MRTLTARICILGSGPAGLGAAYELKKLGENNVVIIDRNHLPGGLARTEVLDGNRFDIGPHRFFTSNKEVNHLWHKTLGNDFRPVQRLTRIYYSGKLFKYPINAIEAITKLRPVESLHALISYSYACMTRDPKKALNFEEWVTAQFGEKLYETFFKIYTEKVWGIPCREIVAEWAAQRIKGLNLSALIKNAFGIQKQNIKTLVDEFDYPTNGSGMMYERILESLLDSGQSFLNYHTVTNINTKDNKIDSIQAISNDGIQTEIYFQHLITGIPVTKFINMIYPSFDNEIIQATETLYYRDHITINLVVDAPDLFHDQWIYVHSPDVKMARVANYNNFSNKMPAKKGTSLLSVEYFVFANDHLWKMADDDLIAFAVDELTLLHLIPKGSALQGWVVRETETYPTYYLGYRSSFLKIRSAIDTLENCMPVGRGGLYRYNNMDHAIYTGMLATRNILSNNRNRYDLWRVNIDAQYLEGAERE